jgi:hypothetical protein
MAKKDPGVSVTAVISPLDRLKLEVLVRDEIITRGQNSSVSSMVNTFLGIMLSSSLMQKKILACAEQQVAQDIKLGRNGVSSALSPRPPRSRSFQSRPV